MSLFPSSSKGGQNHNHYRSRLEVQIATTEYLEGSQSESSSESARDHSSTQGRCVSGISHPSSGSLGPSAKAFSLLDNLGVPSSTQSEDLQPCGQSPS